MEATAELLELPPEVEGLQQHVAELGEGDPVLAVHAAPDRVLGHHLVDGGVLAHVSQELEQRDAAEPVLVVHQAGGGGALEVEQALELGPDAGPVGGQRLRVEEGPLLGPAAGIAHHAGGPSDQRQRAVAGLLEPAQHQHPDQMAEVEAVGGGVDAEVQNGGRVVEQGGQLPPVGVVVDQAPGLEVCEQGGAGHGRSGYRTSPAPLMSADAPSASRRERRGHRRPARLHCPAPPRHPASPWYLYCDEKELPGVLRASCCA